uniref:Deoxynucleoside kinase n=1 Tax=Pithovirus LCPAC001 TaxID=2506585 RepID=A0A481Z3A7_9VIRU|nr:MAG: deoxynucleoside kinase [Pithovirus LCPAC001]
MSSPNIKIYNETNEHFVKLRCLGCSIIIVEGLVGAGKTTAGTSLKKCLREIGFKNVKFFKEYVNKDLLNQYISDMKKYSYSFQIIMLIKRLEIYRNAIKYSKTGGIAIVDRSLLGDYTFAHMQYKNSNMNEKEWEVYTSIRNGEKKIMPSLIMYLNTSAQTSYERMIKRGYKSEINGYTLEYFEELKKNYEYVIRNTDCNVINIDWNNNLEMDGSYLRQSESLKLLYKFKEFITT